MEPGCDTCRFWESYSDLDLVYGPCHRFPPVIVAGAEIELSPNRTAALYNGIGVSDCGPP